MKYLISLIFLLLFGLKVHSQNYITSIPFDLKKGGKSFSYVDKSNNEVYLFISNSKKIRATHYNNKLEIIDTLTSVIPNIKINNLVGFTKNDSNINLIWISKSFDKISFQSIDFKNKKTSNLTQELSFKGENVLQFFSTNDNFYCLSIIDNSSIVKLYKFNNKNQLDIKTINISDHTFLDSNNSRANLFDLFKEHFESFEFSFELQNIDYSIPTSLAISSKKRKAYLLNNELTLTFDNSNKMTQLVKINLIDFNVTTTDLEKTNIESLNDSSIQSNSYLFENKLYQFAISSYGINFSIKNLDKTLINEYIVNSKDEIPFKRSDFLSEWVNIGGHSKIESTDQFLQILLNSRIGISCYNYKNNKLVSFGGISARIKKIDEDEEKFNYFAMPIGGGLIGAILSVVLTNSFYNNYISSRNIISINSQVSSDNVLQDGKVNSCITSKICTFFNGFSEIKYPTIFSIKDKTYVGHFNENAKQFVILKFEN